MNEIAREEGIIKGGDVDVLSVQIWPAHWENPVELGNLWQNISIFENIEKNYIEGQITLIESLDLLGYIPVITNEKIVISFSTPGAERPYRFEGHLHEIPNRIQVIQGKQAYVLGFISPEFINNKNYKFSKAYNKTLISDMVKDVHSQFIQGVNGKKLDVIPTFEQTSRVVPTMSPFKAINWLSKWAVSPTYRTGASYLFFENQRGYYFGPIEELVDIRKSPAAIYTKELVPVQEGPQKEVGRVYHAISDIEMITPKHLNNIARGGYASKTKTHDIVKRTIEDVPYNYFEKYSEQGHLESSDENTMLHNDIRLGKYSDSFIQHVPDHYLAYTGQSSYRTVTTTLTRTSQFQHFFSKQLKITVPGDSDRTIGEVIHVEIPSASPNLKDGDVLDKYYSGSYLITALRHTINKSDKDNKITHNIQMVLSSDSYKTPLPNQTIGLWF